MRRKSAYGFTKNIIALGDFNIPMAQAGDPIFDALTKRGLTVPQHSTQIGATIQTDNQYDQMAFFTGAAGAAFVQSGVFDFDGAIFNNLWQNPNRTEQDFLDYVKYYISDHRILWSEFLIA